MKFLQSLDSFLVYMLGFLAFIVFVFWAVLADNGRIKSKGKK